MKRREKEAVIERKDKGFMYALRKYRAPYIFIAPFFIMFLVFQLIPVVWTFFISFYQWRGYGTMRWVGLRNIGSCA